MLFRKCSNYKLFYGSVIAQIILRRYPDLVWSNEIRIIIYGTFLYVYDLIDLLFR